MAGLQSDTKHKAKSSQMMNEPAAEVGDKNVQFLPRRLLSLNTYPSPVYAEADRREGHLGSPRLRSTAPQQHDAKPWLLAITQPPSPPSLCLAGFGGRGGQLESRRRVEPTRLSALLELSIESVPWPRGLTVRSTKCSLATAVSSSRSPTIHHKRSTVHMSTRVPTT